MQIASWQFARLGTAIGFRPFLFLLLSFLILVPGFYGLFFRRSVHLGIDEGFTRLDAPSRREISYQKAFFGASESAVPWYLATFGAPRFENGSMMNDDEFDEFYRFYTKITEELTMPGPNETHITYRDICNPFCDINDMLVKGMTAPSFLVDKAYPNFDVFGFDVSVGKFIFMRNTSKSGELVGSKLMVMYFTVFVENEETKLQLDELDKKIIKLTESHNANSTRKVNIILHGNYPVQLEVERGFKETIPLIFGGILAGLVIFSIIILVSAKLHRQLGWNMGIWILAAIMIVILSLPAAVGSTCLLGMPINVTVAMTPFLAISIVLNAIFIFYFTDIWHKITLGLEKKTPIFMMEVAEFGKNRNKDLVANQKNQPLIINGKNQNSLPNGNSVVYRVSKPERLGYVFQKIEKSFLTFFLVSTISLGIAAFFSIPNYQMIFTFFSFEIFYLSFLQIFFFSPIVILTSKRAPESFDESHSNREKKSCIKEMKKCLRQKFISPLLKFIQSKCGKLFIFLLFVLGLSLSVYGVRNIENSMDFKRVMPENSPNLEAFGFMDQHVWNDFLQFVFIVKNPPKFDSPTEFKPFKKMIDELESLPMAYGQKSNLMWLFDYSKHELGINYHKANFESVNMSRFKEFITTEPYSAWNDGVKWEINPKTNEIKIKEMLFMITFKGITSLQGKVDALTACRAILDQYSQFDIASFDTDSATVDTILSVPPTIISVVLVLVALTAVISCLTIQNMVGTILTTIFIVTNIIYLFGFGHFLNIELDPLGVGTFVFSILVGNYLVIQAVSIFLTNNKEPNRLRVALEAISCQVLKLIVLTTTIGVPVLFAPVFIHRSNIQIFLVSLLVSVLHAIFFIPTALNLFPAPYTGDAYCYDSE